MLSKTDILKQHMNAELAGDLDGTMATMTQDPHLINVPVGISGIGKTGVRDFYKNHLVGKFFPPDVQFISISQTIGETQLVDELVIKFTHTMEIEWMLPGIAPTHKPVEAVFVVIVGFAGDKVAYEHIHWDQASVLAQLGLLDAKKLPISGARGAQLLLSVVNTTSPSKL